MCIIPHSLAAAATCRDFITLWFTGVCQSGRSIYVVWQYVAGMAGTKAVAPRYAVIAAMIIGIVIVIAQGDVVTTDVVFKPVLTQITPDFAFAHSLSVALPLFLVTMASQTHRVSQQ